MKNPKICVIIPNWNGKDHLKYSLASILATVYEKIEIVVIDDRSTDDSVAFIESQFPTVKILHNQRKQGYAGSVNTGLIYAMSQSIDFVAIANNDIQVQPDWLDAILPIFSSQENVGFVGFREVLRQQEAIFFNYQHLSHSDLNMIQVQSIPGCLYLCPIKMFQQIGLFDEYYFMYGEDNDIFYRSIKAGFLIIQTSFPVWHYGEGSSNKKPLRPTWLAYRNALRFSIKNENLIRNLRMLLSLLHQGCNPLATKRPDNPNYRRLRRFNELTNLGLVFGSVAWNIWHLKQTISLNRKTLPHKLTRYD